MRGEWKFPQVAEAPVEIIDGDRGHNYPKQDDFSSSGHCLFLNTGNVTLTGFNFSDCAFVTKEKDETLRKGKLKRCDVVLTTRGTVGNVAFYDSSVPFEHVRLNSGMVILRASQEELLPRYLYLFLRSRNFKDQVASLTTGSAQPQLPIRDIRKVEIPLPPLSEQRAIASVLGALDDKIELNRRMNETLEALAQSLFKSWFVDATQSALPKGWRVSTIGEEVRVVGGSTPSTTKPEFWEGGTHHWATPKDLSDLNSPVLLETGRKISDAGIQQISSGLLPVGTVLLSSRAPIGYLVIAEVPVAINQGFIAMFCDGSLPNHYVRLWTKANMDAIEGRANGTTFMEISKGNFRSLPVIVPPKPMLDDFQKQVEPLHRRVVSNLKESRTLAALRDALLPKLLSGELRLPSPRLRQTGVPSAGKSVNHIA